MIQLALSSMTPKEIGRIGAESLTKMVCNIPLVVVPTKCATKKAHPHTHQKKKQTTTTRRRGVIRAGPGRLPERGPGAVGEHHSLGITRPSTPSSHTSGPAIPLPRVELRTRSKWGSRAARRGESKPAKFHKFHKARRQGATWFFHWISTLFGIVKPERLA